MAEAVLLIFLTVINLVLWAVFIIRFKKMFSPEILLSDIKNEVDKLLIEINRTVDADITLIESRRESLRELLQTADKRLALLQKEEGDRLREERVLKKLSSSGPSRISLQTSQTPSQEKPQVPADDGRYKPPVLDEGIQLAIDFNAYRPLEEPEIVNESPGEAEKEIPLRDQVLHLYERGLSADLISQRIKLPVSAVQFIIDTFGQ